MKALYKVEINAPESTHLIVQESSQEENTGSEIQICIYFLLLTIIRAKEPSMEALVAQD